MALCQEKVREGKHVSVEVRQERERERAKMVG